MAPRARRGSPGPGRRRLPRLLAAAGAVAVVVAATAGPGPADAQVTGGCTATVNGQDVGAARSASSAIEVDVDDTVQVVGTAPGPIDGYQVDLTFGPASFTAADGTVDDEDTTYTEVVEISDYATYGVGLYRVEGTTTGTPCSTWAYVKVTGRNPLTTVAGIVGAVLTVGGVAGMATAMRRPKGVPA